ncbi:hypothetical protein P692DRAFT_20250935 [Suillus brevipes Sb2]|nr:hypothetical protein P692DRAFT_20250935 [Suillus brevipes Sb2]
MRDDVSLVKITVPSLLNSPMPSIHSQPASQEGKPTSKSSNASTVQYSPNLLTIWSPVTAF